MKKTLALILPAAILIAGCASSGATRTGAEPVGRIDAVPFGVFASDVPGESGASFFNDKLQWYDVIRPVDDTATVLFFLTQDDADNYVRARFAADRRDSSPLFDSWPPPVARVDYDFFASRDLGGEIKEQIDLIRNGTISIPNIGDTGHPTFRHELSGRITEYPVYIRDGRVAQTMRLTVMSANLHFQSVQWDSQ